MLRKLFACSLVAGLALTGSAIVRAAGPEGKPAMAPYPLDVCPVSGKELGTMGDPIVKVYDGREVRFCCPGCVKPFESDQAKYTKKIDEMIVKDQLRYYPMTTCVVSTEPLVEDGESIAKDVVFRNRLVRLCCGGCMRELKKDPEKFMGKLDKAVAEAQRKDYPLETCVISGERLGEMGEPKEIVVGGRLVRLCCGGCMSKVMANPAKCLATIDKAWQAKGKYEPAEGVAQGQ